MKALALLGLLAVVACGGTLEPSPPCATDAGIGDVVSDTATDTTADAGSPCLLLCDSIAGWTCGSRILGSPESCDPQAPTCGCLGAIGYVCHGVPADDATSCAKCGTRCNSTPDAGAGEQ